MTQRDLQKASDRIYRRAWAKLKIAEGRRLERGEARATRAALVFGGEL